MLYARHAYDFANTAESVGLARQAVRETLTAWRCAEDLIESALLITSELAANAVTHAAASPVFTLCCARRQDALTIAVGDADPRPPARADTGDDAETGRGLRIVESLSAAWGYESRPAGKLVYARLAPSADGAGKSLTNS